MEPPVSTFRISGFREAVVIVSDELPHLRTWLDVAGWEIQHHGDVDASMLNAWGAVTATAKEWLVAHPAWPTGHIRLVKIEGLSNQVQIREDDECWDPGGIFDLNVRARDITGKARALRNLGWHGASPPVQWDFGAFTVSQWLAKGADNVRLALIQRVSPPLEGFEHLRDLSHVFNSSQIVRDMPSSLAFYRDVLGFLPSVSVRKNAIPPGPNVFGLPTNLTQNIGMDISILHPEGKMEGSIELVSLLGAEGLNKMDDARPPNLGIAALRFPTYGLAALEHQLRRHGWPIEFTHSNITIVPYGRVKVLAVRAPEGAWLEFYETE